MTNIVLPSHRYKILKNTCAGVILVHILIGIAFFQNLMPLPYERFLEWQRARRRPLLKNWTPEQRSENNRKAANARWDAYRKKLNSAEASADSSTDDSRKAAAP